MTPENTDTPLKADCPSAPCSARIIQLLIAPNDATWQGVLLGLGDDGVTYHCQAGHWEPYIPPIGYMPNNAYTNSGSDNTTTRESV